MKCSVIIPCYNASGTMSGLLRSLAEQSWPMPWEVIISDNGSTDDFKSVVQQYEHRIPELRIVDASSRRGASHARNVGADAAMGDTLLFCDADDEPAAGWSRAMARALKNHGLVAARMSFDKLNPPALRKVRGTTQVDGLQRFSFLPYPHAAGGTLGIKRALHEAVGGFDEDILICEDVDYCMRVQQMGIPLRFVPDAEVHYRLPRTLAEIYHQAARYAEHEVYLFEKYAERRQAGELWRWRKYMEVWYCVLRRAPKLIRAPEDRSLLLWRLGRQIGLMKESIRFHGPPIITD